MAQDEKRTNPLAAPPEPPEATRTAAPQGRAPASQPSGGSSFRDMARAELRQRARGARPTYTDDSGVQRYEGRMIGPGMKSRPDRIGVAQPDTSFRAGALSSAGVGRLASGSGESGEAVFDNESIQQGMNQGVIADPQAERERISRNNTEAARVAAESRPRLLREGLLSPEQAQAEETIDRSREDVANERFRTQAQAIASLNRGVRGADERRGQERFTGTMREVLTSTYGMNAEDVADRDFNIEFDRTQQLRSRPPEDGGLPVDISDTMAADLTALAMRAPDFKQGIIGANPGEGLTVEDGFGLIYDMALSDDPDQRVFNMGRGRVDIGEFPEAVQTRMGRMRDEMRESIKRQGIEILTATGDPSALSGAQRKVVLDAAKAARAEAIREAEQEGPFDFGAMAAEASAVNPSAFGQPGPGNLDRFRRAPATQDLPDADDETDLLSWFNQVIRRSEDEAGGR